MICSNLALPCKFQNFQRPIYNLVEYLRWILIIRFLKSVISLKYFTSFNPIQDCGRGAKRPPPLLTSFSSVTSANVEISPRNFLTFSFNPYVTLVQNFKSVPSASP